MQLRDLMKSAQPRKEYNDIVTHWIKLTALAQEGNTFCIKRCYRTRNADFYGNRFFILEIIPEGYPDPEGEYVYKTKVPMGSRNILCSPSSVHSRCDHRSFPPLQIKTYTSAVSNLF